ncbi:MAG: hypothetical protein CWE10_20400 [Symbiobacterium thermophilum]|uniref:Uncharacterized protein n=1 Tax=Symbiobacterium thermophilum TaxID=2734 RepID=A0A953ICW4_SYMTR|nr:hypothetical protein [Symbiobacterium thermophilum]
MPVGGLARGLPAGGGAVRPAGAAAGAPAGAGSGPRPGQGLRLQGLKLVTSASAPGNRRRLRARRTGRPYAASQASDPCQFRII